MECPLLAQSRHGRVHRTFASLLQTDFDHADGQSDYSARD